MKLMIRAAALCGPVLSFDGSAAAATFAAISYNKETGYYGYSQGYHSRDAAEERAAQECGPGCETIMWARDSCVALATATSHAYGTGRDTDQESAGQMAMNICSGYADDCSVVAETCSDQ
jgi:hypothetical protein